MKIQTSPGNLSTHRKYLKILRTIQSVMDDMGYDHINVPILAPQLIPESYLEIFKTEFKYMDNSQDLYLAPSPELFLKRLIAQGIGNCYALTKTFRNGEPSSSKHSPEFTLLEFYKVQADYMELAEDVLKLFREIAHALYGTDHITYNGKIVQLNAWEEITVTQAFEKYADIHAVLDEEYLMRRADEKGYDTQGFSYVDVWSQIYAQEIEPYLGKNGHPTLIYEYPRPLAATAQFDPKRKVAQRLEVYIDGVELGNCGNASTSKTNRIDEEKKLFHENSLREKMHLTEHKPDMEFANVLTKMPPTAGIAIGVERLGMVFTDSESIHDLQVISVQ